MKTLSRRFMVGALMVCMGIVSLGMTASSAEAGLPKIPKIPGVSGLTPAAIQALLQNHTAQQELIGLLQNLIHQGYVPKSASYNSLTGELTIFSKNPLTKQSRADVIFLFDDVQTAVKSKK